MSSLLLPHWQAGPCCQATSSPPTSNRNQRRDTRHRANPSQRNPGDFGLNNLPRLRLFNPRTPLYVSLSFSLPKVLPGHSDSSSEARRSAVVRRRLRQPCKFPSPLPDLVLPPSLWRSRWCISFDQTRRRSTRPFQLEGHRRHRRSSRLSASPLETISHDIQDLELTVSCRASSVPPLPPGTSRTSRTSTPKPLAAGVHRNPNPHCEPLPPSNSSRQITFRWARLDH
jgi:hypothetical protein